MTSVNRNIIGVAVDTPSTDYGQSRDFKTHQVLGKYNLWGLENLGNAESLPLHGFTIYNMVDLLKEGSGAPSRVFAILDGSRNGVDHISVFNLIIVLAILSFLIVRQNLLN